jgi:hypothetical protein
MILSPSPASLESSRQSPQHGSVLDTFASLAVLARRTLVVSIEFRFNDSVPNLTNHLRVSISV